MSTETSSVLSWKQGCGADANQFELMSSTYMQESQKIPAVTFLWPL